MLLHLHNGTQEVLHWTALVDAIACRTKSSAFLDLAPNTLPNLPFLSAFSPQGSGPTVAIFWASTTFPATGPLLVALVEVLPSHQGMSRPYHLQDLLQHNCIQDNPLSRQDFLSSSTCYDRPHCHLLYVRSSQLYVESSRLGLSGWVYIYPYFTAAEIGSEVTCPRSHRWPEAEDLNLGNLAGEPYS